MQSLIIYNLENIDRAKEIDKNITKNAEKMHKMLFPFEL
jgi:hypothetical protein